MKKLISILTISILILSFSSFAFAKGPEAKATNPSTGAVVADILVLRPLGAVGTILGAAALVATYPVTVALNDTPEAEDFLVMRPLHYTFERPLGQM